MLFVCVMLSSIEFEFVADPQCSACRLDRNSLLCRFDRTVVGFFGVGELVLYYFSKKQQGGRFTYLLLAQSSCIFEQSVLL